MADAAIERYVHDDLNGTNSVDGGNAVLDFVDPDGTGSTSIALERRQLYGSAVDQILAQEDVTESISSADRVYWPLVDHLGTVRDLVENDGTLGEHYEYDSYGNVTSGDTSLTRYLFTSREFDPDTGLQYNRARWYDAAVGRWISQDPLAFAAGDANLFRFVGNNSVLLTDASGLQPPPVSEWYEFSSSVDFDPEKIDLVKLRDQINDFSEDPFDLFKERVPDWLKENIGSAPPKLVDVLDFACQEPVVSSGIALLGGIGAAVAYDQDLIGSISIPQRTVLESDILGVKFQMSTGGEINVKDKNYILENRYKLRHQFSNGKALEININYHQEFSSGQVEQSGGANIILTH